MTNLATVEESSDANFAIGESARGWDEIYARGEDANEQPWSNVVSFVHRFVRPRERDQDRDRASYLELGFGSGPNLMFAARLGLDCAGIDVSKVAVDECARRLERDDLTADIRHCPFGELPFPRETFDCVVDRASLMFADPETLSQTVDEVHRVLKPGGFFFHNTIADDVAANLVGAHAGEGSSGTATYAKYPDFQLTSASDLARRFGKGWAVRELKRIERTVYVPALDVTAEWELVAQKI